MVVVSSEVVCPVCKSRRNFRDGFRKLKNGYKNQRWLCRECGHRFSEQQLIRITQQGRLNRTRALQFSNQICALEAKNLEPQTETKTVAGESPQADAKGKIVEYSFWLLKQGYAESTIEGRIKVLKRLVKLGANILDPETIKEVLTKQTWSEGRKEFVVEAYSNFLNYD